MLPPTIPKQPTRPCSRSITFIEPARLPQTPVARPSISAASGSGSVHLALEEQPVHLAFEQADREHARVALEPDCGVLCLLGIRALRGRGRGLGHPCLLVDDVARRRLAQSIAAGQRTHSAACAVGAPSPSVTGAFSDTSSRS